MRRLLVCEVTNMEIIIAVGLGAWFALTGLVSCLAVFESFSAPPGEAGAE